MPRVTKVLVEIPVLLDGGPEDAVAMVSNFFKATMAVRVQVVQKPTIYLCDYGVDGVAISSKPFDSPEFDSYNIVLKEVRGLKQTPNSTVTQILGNILRDAGIQVEE